MFGHIAVDHRGFSGLDRIHDLAGVFMAWLYLDRIGTSVSLGQALPVLDPSIQAPIIDLLKDRRRIWAQFHVHQYDLKRLERCVTDRREGLNSGEEPPDSSGAGKSTNRAHETACGWRAEHPRFAEFDRKGRP